MKARTVPDSRGLVPAIHVFLCRRAGKQDVDARDTSAFTRVFDAVCAGMTAERYVGALLGLFRRAR
jgi:hypothetical protein